MDIKRAKQFLKEQGYDKNVTIVNDDVEALLEKYLAQNLKQPDVSINEGQQKSEIKKMPEVAVSPAEEEKIFKTEFQLIIFLTSELRKRGMKIISVGNARLGTNEEKHYIKWHRQAGETGC